MRSGVVLRTPSPKLRPVSGLILVFREGIGLFAVADV